MKLSVVRPNPTAGGGGDLKADGTIPLTANWDAGSYKITAQQLESDVATGTAPLVITSTTKVSNLNADLLDDQTGSYYLDSLNFTNIDPRTNDFRLTLTTAIPVTTSDVTGAVTIYCCPYIGNKIALYNGSSWVLHSSSEFSLGLGTLTSGRPYDVFCYSNSGTPTLEFTSWTNATTRTTGLAYQDGVLVKSGSTTRRYLGTFYTTATTTTEDSVTKRFLWNYYNRVVKPMRVLEGTNSWTYTTATIRQARATTTNRLDFVIGVSEDVVTADVFVCSANSTGSVPRTVGIGLDSTTTLASSCVVQSTAGIASALTGCSAKYTDLPGIGFHYLAWLEWSTATGTTTWYGDNGGSLVVQSGILGNLLC